MYWKPISWRPGMTDDSENFARSGCTPAGERRRPVNMFPMLASTSAMVRQLSADLYECLDCSWMLVATRIAGKTAPLVVFGAPPGPDCATSIECAQMVRPIAVERAPAVLAIGSKTSGAAYIEEEIELTEEFAAHIAKILSKEARVRSWIRKTA